MGGKTLLSVSGSAIVWPPAMLARAFAIARSTTLLPAVREVIVSASRIGTPDEISVDSVRVTRAIAAFRMRSPNTGIFSMRPSIRYWPFSVLYAARIAKMTIGGTHIRYQKFAIRKFDRLITNCVGEGRSAPKLLKTSAKTGMTQMSSTRVTMTAADTMQAG